MNQSPEHHACICLGSNIDPAENLRKAVQLLRERTRVIAQSLCWETEAVGSPGPNFLNLGVCIATSLDPLSLKEQVLAPIEKQLGRVRSADKNAPRTIDLDITLYDGQAIDQDLWQRVYLALIFSELVPGLSHPQTGEPLELLAQRMQREHLAIPHPELEFA